MIADDSTYNRNFSLSSPRLAAAADAPRSGTSDKSSSTNCTLDKRPSALIRRYGSLYAQARIDTLDALEKLPQLSDCDELKSKLLFSVVVVSGQRVEQRTLRGIFLSVFGFY